MIITDDGDSAQDKKQKPLIKKKDEGDRHQERAGGAECMYLGCMEESVPTRSFYSR